MRGIVFDYESCLDRQSLTSEQGLIQQMAHEENPPGTRVYGNGPVMKAMPSCHKANPTTFIGSTVCTTT